ncbi:MAG: hypothetical protein KDC80_04625 [Saprospiraceae bacterium]|nr:hypothetical protein [Saprospiraceae bacterium]
MAKIYYVGDWAVLTGPVFAETPFHYSHKGLDIFNYGIWLKEALESSGEHQVESVSAWDFYNKLGPGDYEKILADYDIIVFSDVDAKLFQLSPAFFDRQRFGEKPLTFPDRIRLSIEALQGGTHFMFLGGWYSFTGEMGKGGWGRTRIKEMLPVSCLEIEDLVESTEGFHLEALGNWDSERTALVDCPPILGYNLVKRKPDADVLLRFKETGDPALALATFGKGRSLAFMSDPAPHWGLNFVYWKGYQNFWLHCVDLLLKD